MADDSTLHGIPNYAAWLIIDQVAELMGVTYIAVQQWIKNGVKVEGGAIHLRAVKIGARWKIEPAAVTEFVAAMTRNALPASAAIPLAPSMPDMSAVAPETPAQRQRRYEDCMARLRAKGVTGEPPIRHRRGASNEG